MKSTDKVDVSALSESGKNESIARVSINGAEMRLRFRLYDNGWKWESAETTVGNWVAASETVKQVREATRLKKAHRWAQENKELYVSTIRTLDRYAGDFPRRPSWGFTQLEWLRMRHELAQRAPDFLDWKPADKAIDAWGSPLLLAFDSSSRSAIFLSAGPDKRKATPDDIVVRIEGRREWDDFYDSVMWNYYKHWSVPEGLEEPTKASTEKDTVDIAGVRAVEE